MAEVHIAILTNAIVLAELKRAWQESRPGISDAHEEGGFILRDATGNISVDRWRQGAQQTIILPPHLNSKTGEKEIVASFYTHPNIGADFLQEPSETDKRAVRDDPDLKGVFYEGELVISQEKIYLITPNGQVNEVGNTRDISK